MKTFFFIAALMLSSAVVFGQEPVKKTETKTSKPRGPIKKIDQKKLVPKKTEPKQAN